MSSNRAPLVLNEKTMKEIAHEVVRIFGPHTENISIRADEFCLQIMVYPDSSDFILPQGPLDLRIWEEKMRLFLDRRV